jgi:hypothetical protein
LISVLEEPGAEVTMNAYGCSDDVAGDFVEVGSRCICVCGEHENIE